MKVPKIEVLFIFIILTGPILCAQNLYLSIQGHDVTETQVIDSLNYKKVFKDYKSLQKEIDSTHFRLQHLGYIENRIKKTEKINDSTFSSKFALNRKYDTIYIYTPENSFSEQELNMISTEVSEGYFSIPISQTEEALRYLNELIIERGQPFASLKLIRLEKKDEDNLKAELQITKNKKRTIDGIVIKGYEKFPRSFLKHYLRIKKNSDFNLATIKKKTERLNALRFANETRSPEVLFTRDSTTLYFYIEKVKSNTFDGFLGFGTNEETNKLEFDGYLNLNLTNSLNFGETFNLQYKSDENDQKTFNAQVDTPYLFGTAIGAELGLSIFKRDSSFTTVSQNADIYYQLNSNHRIAIGINALQSNNLLETDAFNIQDLSSTFYTLKYQWVQPQYRNLLFPEKFKLNTALGFGQREHMNTKEDQQIFDLRAFNIFNLNLKNSIFLRLTGSGMSSSTYFENELLRFGGINSIRGFEENSLLASLFGVINTEYRYQLNPTIYAHSILDFGYLENDIINSKEKLFGFGFGFGILTKAGLLKFNYANGKFEGQNFKLSNSKIHLSLNALF